MDYQITDAVSVYFEAQNLLDEPLRSFIRASARARCRTKNMAVPTPSA